MTTMKKSNKVEVKQSIAIIIMMMKSNSISISSMLNLFYTNKSNPLCGTVRMTQLSTAI